MFILGDVNFENLNFVEANLRKTINEIVRELGVYIATVSRHLSAVAKLKKLDTVNLMSNNKINGWRYTRR